MKIAVCIKQVPDAKDIQWTSNNTMKREGVESVINPCDLYALESALVQKRQNPNVKIAVFTMGPKQAESVLREAIALGADEAFLVCDKKFSGSDTLATGITLSRAIQVAAPDFSLVMCGQFASDGDTAQTGVEIAQNLNAYQITYATEITELTQNYVVANQNCETYEQKVQSPLPCVVCLEENKNIQLSNALIEGQIRAQDAKIEILDAEKLNLDENICGIKGSPTYVSNVFRPTQERKCETVDEQDAANFVIRLIDEVSNN